MKLSEIEKQINSLQESMRLSFRRTIEDAIKIGELLTIAKKQLSHGDFMPWCKKIGINYKNAERYIKLEKYKIKLDKMSNLTEAYKLIESEENKRKRKEFEEQTKRIREYKKTGIKPDGWNKKTDEYRLKKEKEDKEYEERKRKAFEEKKKKYEEELKQEEYESNEINNIFEEISIMKESILEKEKIFKKMKMSGNNSNDIIYDALYDYLNKLDDNQRLEACHNIIKFCKTIASELQIKSVN